jgi:hypothetical protein
MDVPGTLKSGIVQPPPKPWERAFVAQLSATAKREPTRRFRRPARERHKMVVFLHCSGWKNNDIASAMGYKSAAQVSIIINSQHPELLALKDRAQEMVASATTDVMLRFRQEANKSVETLVQVRDQTADVSQRRLAARDILDRAGYAPVRKQINFNTAIPIEKLEAIVERVEEANDLELHRAKWAVTNPSEVATNATP